FLLKIHGDLANPSSVVVTEEDFILFTLRLQDDRRPILPETILYHSIKWTSLLIGWSFRDYNQQLLWEALKYNRSRLPNAYALESFPDPFLDEIWYRRHSEIKLIVQDQLTFVPELYRAISGKEMNALAD